MKMAALLLALSCSGNGGPGEPGVVTPPNVDLALQPIASGLSSPVHLASPPNDARLFIVEQAGRIRVIQNGALLPTAFLDIRNRVKSGGEEGLLSVAFHPQYASNRHFYVYYTDLSGDIQIDRYTASQTAPNTADATTVLPIINVSHPSFGNHNGGQLAFGPDGHLYIGTGDGGAANDPPNNAQNLGSLLGKILRISLNSAGAIPAYSIPDGNPFAGQAGRRPEIWAYGLRNPWRFSFDRGSSTIFIGDVGQNSREEIDAVALTPGGRNFGWRIMEGAQCRGLLPCDQSGLTLPVHEYETSGGNCAVTGGFVYRGTSIPQIAGVYFFSDYCKGELRSFRLVNGAATEVKVWPVTTGATITSFGEDSSGELYLISHGGTISKIIPAP